MHTLLEQSTTISDNNNILLYNFFQSVMGFEISNDVYLLNKNGYISFFIEDIQPTSMSSNVFYFKTKEGDIINNITKGAVGGTIFSHISTQETVKYFKYAQKSAANAYTYILAQDKNDEWVVFNGDKIYSDYGETGIYNNPQIGRPELVDGDNQFLISKACRIDTGTEFKELYFVLSAKSYSDINCIVDYGGKTYRLVSVSNVRDEAGRYPAFAFPVSD